MTNIEKRIAKLESATGDQDPIMVWEGGPIPDNPTGREVITVRWAKSTDEATLDPSKSVQARQGTIE